MKQAIKRIPARPDLAHLKKQAKQLLTEWRHGVPAAFERLRNYLPAAAALTDTDLVEREPRLHDAQSCIAREYGFASWTELAGFVAARRAVTDDPARTLQHWLALAYPGDLVGTMDRAQPKVAARLLAEEGGALLGEDPWLACAVGDLGRLRAATERDPGWVRRAGGPLALPPLLAVAQSSLVQLPEFAERLRDCARFLLEAGADPNQSTGSRWPPASVAAPSKEHFATALYGAAGQNGDAEMTRLLLAAGAAPDDGESLYHSLEHRACARLLLEAGARIEGTAALYRVLDRDDLPMLRLLLEHGADPNEAPPDGPANEWPSPLLWAIRRGRSVAHIEALLAAGADPAAPAADGADAATLARRFGLPDVATLLGRDAAPATPGERFVAACARGDETVARALLDAHRRLIKSLSPTELRLLPELAALGRLDAVRCMVRLGWPIATRGGDWDASALNQAVFRGNAEMTRFLLAHGAQWTERHGYDSDCAGTLSWASCNEPADIEFGSAEPGIDSTFGDWLGCARALVEHGMPRGRPDPRDPEAVLIGKRSLHFSDEVTDFLLGAAA